MTLLPTKKTILYIHLVYCYIKVEVLHNNFHGSLQKRKKSSNIFAQVTPQCLRSRISSNIEKLPEKKKQATANILSNTSLLTQNNVDHLMYSSFWRLWVPQKWFSCEIRNHLNIKLKTPVHWCHIIWGNFESVSIKISFNVVTVNIRGNKIHIIKKKMKITSPLQTHLN